MNFKQLAEDMLRKERQEKAIRQYKNPLTRELVTTVIMSLNAQREEEKI